MMMHLGEMPIEMFLDEYWQQKPLLIRQAFSNFQSPLSADELAGLACDTDTARIVLEKGGKRPWELRSGPFRHKEFAKLPATHWTLLVNDVEKLVPELEDFLEPFRFIPDWRIDDLMISYAVDGGSVGPHVDAYDVFLLQAQGERHWQINTAAVAEDNFLPDVDLRILREFSAETEWTLQPGDMLYLPPNVAHYGVARGECMTYSIGFRAPSQADLLEDLLGDLLEQAALQTRYSDPKRRLQTDPTTVAAEDLERLTDFVMQALPDRAMVRAWLEQHLG